MLALFGRFSYFYFGLSSVFVGKTLSLENIGFFLKSISSLKVLLDIMMSA